MTRELYKIDWVKSKFICITVSVNIFHKRDENTIINGHCGHEDHEWSSLYKIQQWNYSVTCQWLYNYWWLIGVDHYSIY